MSGSRHQRRRSRSPTRYQSSEKYSNDRYYSRRHNNHERGHYFEDRKQDEQVEPNINVVLRNLPDTAREIDIQNHLLSMGASIDEVSLIKDRETGESRKFAFVRFTSVGHAIQFVDRNRTFDWNSYFVRVDYSKKNQSSDDKHDWRCTKCGHFNPNNRRSCLECRQSFTTSANEQRTLDREPAKINDGSNDASQTPSRWMLLRQLDNLTTEESLYQAVVESLQGVDRVVLIRDKLTKMSCEFAFIEFDTVRSASVSLEFARELLEVDGRRVSVSFANQESFIPVYGQSEYAISADTYEGLQCYWDKNLYASEYSLAIAKERERKEEEAKKAKEQEQLKAQQVKESLENDLSAFYAEMDAFDGGEVDKKSDIFDVPKRYK